MVIDVDWDTYSSIPTYSGNPYLPNHHTSHEWPDYVPASDAVSVYQRAIVPLRTQQYTGMTVAVAPAIYMYDGAMQRFGGTTVDLTSYVPSSTNYWKRVLLYLDAPTNTMAVVASDEVQNYVEPEFIDLPLQALASAWILLSQGD